MASKKKVTTANEVTTVAENTVPLAFVEGQGLIEAHKVTAKEYIDREYPEISRSPDSIPALLMAILTEVVKGRVER